MAVPESTEIELEVGERLRLAREQRGLTQAQVSTRTRMIDPANKGVSRTALVGYETGTSKPGLREIKLLCEVLLITPNWLVYGTESAAKTALPSMEMVSANNLRDALCTGLAIAALKGHERDSLLGLAMSLAGRQLGDLRLSGLMTYVSFLSTDIEEVLRRHLPDGAAPKTVEDLIELLSTGATSNMGHRLKMDAELNVSPESQWLYPDPKVEKPDK